MKNTEEYDRTSWSEQNDLSTAVRGSSRAGIQTSALSFCGDSGTQTNQTEEYDGTSWSSGGNYPLNTEAGAGSSGPQTAALGFGGYTTNSANVYDGSSWTATASMATARGGLNGDGTNATSAIAFGGAPSRNITEEFTDTAFSTKTVDVS